MNTIQKERFCVADIFNEGFEAYVRRYGPLPHHHYQAANAIMRCRTEELGGHVYRCDSCEHEITLYNSCRNRHCPKCQAKARAQWVQRRIEEVLPVQYFHVVFTVPHELNHYAMRNRRVFYTILFKAVSETLLALGKNPRHLGGQLGFIAVLHTWGQNLIEHIHIHCVVPGGALSVDQTQWIASRNNFLFPIPVMRKLFRGKFLAHFSKAVSSGDIKCLQLHNDNAISFDSLMKKLYRTDWVVYAKKPFATPVAVIKYLGRYTHRVAISDQRILNLENGMVTFSYKDYADKNKRKTMVVTVEEFIRRFMLHIMPDGLMRIRHYGFLSNASKNKKLPIAQNLCVKNIPNAVAITAEKWQRVIEPFCATEVMTCPHCKKGVLKMSKELLPYFNLCASAGKD